MPEEKESDNALKPITSRSVIIAEPESITPRSSPNLQAEELKPARASSSLKHHHSKYSRRLSGRLGERPSPSINSISSLSSVGSDTTLEPNQSFDLAQQPKSHPYQSTLSRADHILSQVTEWLKLEKSKRAHKKTTRNAADGGAESDGKQAASDSGFDTKRKPQSTDSRSRRGDSVSSGGSIALDELDHILSKYVNTESGTNQTLSQRKGSYSSRRKSLRQKSRDLGRRSSTLVSSDTDHPDNELLVPSAEVVLDNTKTLTWSGGLSTSSLDLTNTSRGIARERQAWKQFKTDILTLTHTLKIFGWRRVPMERGDDVDVERLCSALTNAVYVVSPPKDLPETSSIAHNGTMPPVPKKQPPKLLLRIYGPQAEHLVDREKELQILRRLARKKIGPRLLGTFSNGRFEQFFYSRTLTAADIRMPDVSVQIAKRLRELHEGIELLKEERDGGPFVWKRWARSLERAEEVANYLDEHFALSSRNQRLPKYNRGKYRGLVCGVEWPKFREAVDRYRVWLDSQYKGAKNITKHLIFAHNDTQYGNLLLLKPEEKSPLLLPANEHKQLVVIDFEYASANTRGAEFANHFTEWCYNYHHPKESHALNEKRYPTPLEQHRFLKTYIQHHPVLEAASPSSAFSMIGGSDNDNPASPTFTKIDSISSISSFKLDSRPPPDSYAEEEKRREQAVENEIQRLSRDIRLWRAANSAVWVAWGLVQAKIPGMEEALSARRQSRQGDVTPTGSPDISKHNITSESSHNDSLLGQRKDSHLQLASDPLSPEIAALAAAAGDKRPEGSEFPFTNVAANASISSSGVEDDEDENAEDDDDDDENYDCLAYAHERALFFWGDVLQSGVVKPEELPEELLRKVKVVEY